MFNFYLKKLIIKYKAKEVLSGSALILTMFILSGMLLVAISSTYVVTLGIKAGGIQAQSTKAYFLAESGIEEFLWQLRWNDYIPFNEERPMNEAIFSYTLPARSGNTSQGGYEVYRKENNFMWQSIGEFGSTKRAVEVQM